MNSLKRPDFGTECSTLKTSLPLSMVTMQSPLHSCHLSCQAWYPSYDNPFKRVHGNMNTHQYLDVVKLRLFARSWPPRDSISKTQSLHPLVAGKREVLRTPDSRSVNDESSLLHIGPEDHVLSAIVSVDYSHLGFDHTLFDGVN